ncbi:MAG TPA: hypothetical protein VKS79_14240 [Gemmataceae bacterium]|nr:hypothetical protein [Gemmataceae bacterium]
MLPDVQTPALATTTWQPLFLALFPSIQRCVQFAFRHLPPDQQEEAIQAAVANACLRCARLVAQGRQDRIYSSALARFAVAQVRDGRLVGGTLNAFDVLSPYAQRKKHLVRKRLDHDESIDVHWLEAVRAGHRTPIPDQVWFRVDFPEWLASLSRRNRKIANTLAAGHSTNEVAREFSISASRVSQMRRELNESWQRFHGELEANSAQTVDA